MKEFISAMQTISLLVLFAWVGGAYLVGRFPNVFLSWMAMYIVFIGIWAIFDERKRKKSKKDTMKEASFF